jgi:hypothetical protein
VTGILGCYVGGLLGVYLPPAKRRRIDHWGA